MAVVDPAALVPFFQVLEKSIAIQTASTAILGNNPNRVAIIFSNPTANNAFVSTRSGLSVNSGTPVTPNGQPLILTYADVGALVSLPWYVTVGILGQVFTVIEVSYLPRKLWVPCEYPAEGEDIDSGIRQLEN